MLFLLAGRALPQALEALESWPLWRTAGTAAALAALILALQFLFSLVAACLPAPAAALRNRERGAGREGTPPILVSRADRVDLLGIDPERLELAGQLLLSP